MVFCTVNSVLPPNTASEISSLAFKHTYHQSKNEGPDLLSNLGGDVIAKLLQSGEEPLEFAELSHPTGGRQLLISQRR